MSATAGPHTRERFDQHVQRLLDLSVGQAHDAFEDVPWDDPAYALEPGDPRLEPFSFDVLRDTERFGQLNPAERSQLGVDRMAANMRTGWEFENLLQQGLLRRAMRMRGDAREFAYVHHEIIEESQHSMMFHEFGRRHAPHARGMLAIDRFFGDRFVRFSARRAPALFYLLVLGGEVPIDVVQRRALREDEVHPLVERILRIHVEEEARHVSFAAQELRTRVPRMGRLGRHLLALVVPLVLAVMARMMVWPNLWVRRRWGIGLRDLLRAARRPEHRQLLSDSVARIRQLCGELGLLTPPAVRLWRLGGIGDN